MPTGESSLLEAAGVTVSFGGLRAVDDVNLGLHRNEIAGLIGPNGAGKTVLVNVLSGFQRLSTGRVLMAGREITSWSPERRASHGLSRTFQNVRPFSSLDVFSNVELAVRASGARRRQAKDTTWEILDRFGLASTPAQHAGTLPHGQQRLLGVARALALNPDVLILDEPCAGLNDIESDALVEALRKIQSDYNLGILVIEHDMRFIMGLCDRVQVLDYGRTIAEGPPAEIRRNEDVIRAYLGTAAVAGA